MATSLDDETQQPSYHAPSSHFVSSPAGRSINTLRQGKFMPTSPAPEESAGGFMQHQMTDLAAASAKESLGESESIVRKGAEAVDAGDLLRIAVEGQSHSQGKNGLRPRWSTQEEVQVVSGSVASPTSSAVRSGRQHLGDDEQMDELDPSSPLPPPRSHEEAPPSIESPGTSSPPLFRSPVRKQKRKTPPSRTTSPSKDTNASSKSKPTSSHSPSKVQLASLTRSDAWSRSASRSKRQKTVVETQEQDSFANAGPVPKFRASTVLSRILSAGSTMQLPKEMQDIDGYGISDYEDDQEGEEGDAGLADSEPGEVDEHDKEDEDDGDIPEDGGTGEGKGGAANAGSENHSADHDSGSKGEGESGEKPLDMADKKKDESQNTNVLDLKAADHRPLSNGGSRYDVGDTSGSPEVEITVNVTSARDFVQESSHPSTNPEDTTVETILFTPEDAIRRPTSGSMGNSQARAIIPPSSPQQSQPQSQSQSQVHASPQHDRPAPQSQPYQSVAFGESIMGRARRGFTHVGMSQSQSDDPNAIPDRHDLFSSQGDPIESSQAASQSYSAFQPTQVRRSVPSQSEQGMRSQPASSAPNSVHSVRRAGEETEPTQIVSEESHERAQKKLEERQRDRLEEEIDQQGEGDGLGASNAPGQTDQQDRDTQTSSQAKSSLGCNLKSNGTHYGNSASEEIPIHNAAAESVEPTYMTRRSDDEPTQIDSEATQLRLMQEMQAKKDAGVRARTRNGPISPLLASTSRGSEPPSNIKIAEHRMLRRRDLGPTRSAPQPDLLRSAQSDGLGGDKAHIDPTFASAVARISSPPTVPAERSPLRGGAVGASRTGQQTADLDVEMGSPGPVELSSSMQEAEDMLPIAQRTQATQRAPASPGKSASPPPIPPRQTRGGKRRFPVSSPTPSPEKRQVKESPPITFPETEPQSIQVNRKGQEGDEVRSDRQPVFEATLLNGETVQTLPQPVKTPTPVKTYGTRGKATTISPAKPPSRGTPSGDVGASTTAEAMNIAPHRRLMKRTVKRSVTPVTRETEMHASTGSGSAQSIPLHDQSKAGPSRHRPRSRCAVQEDEEIDESPDPLSGVIEMEKGAPREDIEGAEEDVGMGEPLEPESPPTPADSEDYTYRPVKNGDKRGRKSNGTTGEKAGKRKRVGPPSEEGVLDEEGAESEGELEKHKTAAINVETRAVKGKKAVGGANANGKRSKGKHVGPPSEEGLVDGETETDDAEDQDQEQAKLVPAKTKGSAGKLVNGKALPSARLSSRIPSRAASTSEPKQANGGKKNAKATKDIQADPKPSRKMRRSRQSEPDLSADISDVGEPSEPESPPTPVDHTDETFHVAKPKGKIAKKVVSRQASVASTSVSAGPSKSKPAPTARPGARKGRNSRLSIAAADGPALPTPPLSTTQQSATREDEGEGENDEDPKPLVLAYFKRMQSFYPGRVVVRVGEAYRVEYLDGDQERLTLDDLRKCELKRGDKVKCDISALKKRTDLEVAEDWAEGDGDVKLRSKKGDEGAYDIEHLRISRVAVLKLFDDRLVSAEMFDDLPEEEASEDEEEAGGGMGKSNTSITFKIKAGSNTFADKVFLITPTDATTARIRDAITKNGGQLYDWIDLFNKAEFGQFPKIESGRIPFHISPAEFDKGRGGMKVKSMVALCYGIPCLAPAYIEAALADAECDWRPYLISPGTSVLYDSPTSQHVDSSWGSGDWSFRQARHLLSPLANKRVVFLNLNPKAPDLKPIIGVCVFGLGAISYEIITSVDENGKSEYDILLVSNADKDMKKNSLPREISGNKKACDVQWLKQCIVSIIHSLDAGRQSVV